MTRRFSLLLFIAALLITSSVAWIENSPGYMDADYYYAGAQRVAAGQGTSEPYLWNYLNDPAVLPAPSFSYWMPLVSLVSAAGLRLFPGLGFWAARLPLILLAGLIPPLVGMLAFRISRRADLARLAGLLALFPGFYLAYLPTSDAFALEMVLGGMFFLLAGGGETGQTQRVRWVRYFGLGTLAGLFHLARADGMIWTAGALAALWLDQRQEGWLRPVRLAGSAALALTGYLLVMAPWFGRNLNEWGSLMPPGGSRAMWVSAYEQTMVFPASLLTPSAWLGVGWGVHLRARVDAVSGILQTAVAVQGGILLVPFLVGGLWQLRGRNEVRLGIGMWALLGLLMTLVFPFAAVNGSYFHSAAALQPLLWAVAPVGLECLMLAYARWRKAPRPQTLVRFMAVLMLITAVLLSAGITLRRVSGSQPGVWAWDASAAHYRAVEAELVRLGAQPGEAVLVNNPPGYWLAGERPALVIPYGDPTMLLAAARRYSARYLVLEQNNPRQLADLYHGRATPPELEYLASVGSSRLYRINFGE